MGQKDYNTHSPLSMNEAILDQWRPQNPHRRSERSIRGSAQICWSPLGFRRNRVGLSPVLYAWLVVVQKPTKGEAEKPIGGLTPSRTSRLSEGLVGVDSGVFMSIHFFLHGKLTIGSQIRNWGKCRVISPNPAGK